MSGTLLSPPSPLGQLPPVWQQLLAQFTAQQALPQLPAMATRGPATDPARMPSPWMLPPGGGIGPADAARSPFDFSTWSSRGRTFAAPPVQPFTVESLPPAQQAMAMPPPRMPPPPPLMTVEDNPGNTMGNGFGYEGWLPAGPPGSYEGQLPQPHELPRPGQPVDWRMGEDPSSYGVPPDRRTPLPSTTIAGSELYPPQDMGGESVLATGPAGTGARNNPRGVATPDRLTAEDATLPPGATVSADGTSATGVPSRYNGGGAPVGGGTPASGGRYPRIDDIRQPDLDAVRSWFDRSRPEGPKPLDSQAMWMNALINGLANIRPPTPGHRWGPNLFGALGGVAQGYGVEWQNQRTQNREADKELRNWYSRRGDAEATLQQRGYENQVGARRFNRESMVAEDNQANERARIGIAGEQLGISRAQLEMQRQAQAMKFRLLGQQLGLEQQPLAVLSRVLPDVASGDLAVPPGFSIPFAAPGARGQPAAAPTPHSLSALRAQVVKQITNDPALDPVQRARFMGGNDRTLDLMVNSRMQELVGNHILSLMSNPETKPAAMAMLQALASASMTRSRAGQQVRVGTSLDGS